jgi:superfamily II DNA or RNA helicase
LKFFILNGENSNKLTELCEDDNEYDVIFTQEVLKEGIDIRRAFIVA